jgi:hypothetical protein
MGLLTGLLTLPLAPVRGVAWVAEQVQTQAERDLDGREMLSEQLAEVERAHQAGELSEQQRVELEERILDEWEWMSGE